MKRGIVLASMLTLVLAGCSTSDPEAEKNGDEFGARAICQQFIEERLKSPASADYSNEEATQISGPLWEVVGVVDSDNSFGASIRNSYKCRVRFKGDDVWELNSLTGLRN